MKSTSIFLGLSLSMAISSSYGVNVSQTPVKIKPIYTKVSKIVAKTQKEQNSNEAIIRSKQLEVVEKMASITKDPIGNYLQGVEMLNKQKKVETSQAKTNANKSTNKVAVNTSIQPPLTPDRNQVNTTNKKVEDPIGDFLVKRKLVKQPNVNTVEMVGDVKATQKVSNTAINSINKKVADARKETASKAKQQTVRLVRSMNGKCWEVIGNASNRLPDDYCGRYVAKVGGGYTFVKAKGVELERKSRKTFSASVKKVNAPKAPLTPDRKTFATHFNKEKPQTKTNPFIKM